MVAKISTRFTFILELPVRIDISKNVVIELVGCIISKIFVKKEI